MQIANPIYDVVFKYLMEDEAAAKLIIGTIIGQEIEVLSFLPQENTISLAPHSLTVYRLDFSARIRQEDGQLKQVLIEIQKAKYATDLMRFRRYLGKQYQDKRNTYWKQVSKPNTTKKKKSILVPLPIITIYFLGYPLEHATAPIIAVTPQARNLTTGEPLNEREMFISSLNHESYIIQIPYLGPQRQTEVEQLLMVFDQRWVLRHDGHILNINETDYPPKYRPIIRRLLAAFADLEVRGAMEAEDEFLEELSSMERELLQQAETIVEQKQALASKDEALAEHEQTLAEQQQALAEQQRLIEQLQQQLGKA